MEEVVRGSLRWFFVVNHHENDGSDVDYDMLLSTIISMMMLVRLPEAVLGDEVFLL